MDEIQKTVNKDLILREKLALQRTTMANQTTLLAFLRTSMYFFVAGLSIGNFLTNRKLDWVEYSMYLFSILLFVLGVINFFYQKKKIAQSEIHIGDFKMDYLNK